MIALDIRGMYTSTIGSFPLEDTYQNRERCIEDLINIRIDFPVYPQLIDMGRQFLDDLAKQNCGIIAVNNRYKLIEKKINEEVSPPGLEPFLWTVNFLEGRDLKEKVKLKAAVTGPFTLAHYIETKTGSFPLNTAVSDLELVKQLARIISKSCDVASKEASMISIDEPILGLIVGAKMHFGYREDDIVEIYNRLKGACRDKIVGTHVCGRISPLLAKILLRTELNFLSHEFSDLPENINVYKPQELKESGKVLSVGCLSSKNPRVESPQEILTTMEKFREYGEDLIFTPDNGFKNLIVEGSREEGYKISIKKLKNMVKATEKFKAIK